jgi:hypothetical protein
MNKEEIIQQLRSTHKSFIDAISSLSEAQYGFAKTGKWDAGQTLDHLHRAVNTLSRALLLPSFVFRLLFGKAKRPSRDYDGLVARYRQKLEEGGKAHGRYLPQKISFESQEQKEAALRNSVNRICKKIKLYPEEKLDYYILPHPLLGKITLREMMYFTIYHAGHHRDIVNREQGGSKL